MLINDEARERFTATGISGDVLALVDADHHICVSHTLCLSKTNLRVLLISSPKTRPDRKWLPQYVRDGDAVFLVKLWLRDNFLVAMFIYILN